MLFPLLFQAFGFINLVLWAGNLWFVFKETSFFGGAPPPQEKPAGADAYGQQGAYEQDPYASNQGGYQPNYSQEGYDQVRGAGPGHMAACHHPCVTVCFLQGAQYGQGYGQQGAPTSFSNQM